MLTIIKESISMNRGRTNEMKVLRLTNVIKRKFQQCLHSITGPINSVLSAAVSVSSSPSLPRLLGVDSGGVRGVVVGGLPGPSRRRHDAVLLTNLK